MKWFYFLFLFLMVLPFIIEGLYHLKARKIEAIMKDLDAED